MSTYTGQRAKHRCPKCGRYIAQRGQTTGAYLTLYKHTDRQGRRCEGSRLQQRTCKVKGCTRKPHAKGLCSTCYARVRRPDAVPRYSEEHRAKLSAIFRGRPMNQGLEDYWRFMPAKERRKTLKQMARLRWDIPTVWRKECEECHVEFDALAATAVYCSGACRHKAGRHRRLYES